VAKQRIPLNQQHDPGPAACQPSLGCRQRNTQRGGHLPQPQTVDESQDERSAITRFQTIHNLEEAEQRFAGLGPPHQGFQLDLRCHGRWGEPILDPNAAELTPRRKDCRCENEGSQGFGVSKLLNPLEYDAEHFLSQIRGAITPTEHAARDPEDYRGEASPEDRRCPWVPSEEGGNECRIVNIVQR
jgi:hypothetical protein